MLHVEDHLAQLHAWAQQLDASASPQKMDDIISCLEDTVATLLSLFIATPRLCGAVMSESDHAVTTTIAHLHDVFLMGTLQNKLGALPTATVARDRIAAVSVVCARLSCLLLAELLKAPPDVAGPSTSKTASASTKDDGETFMAALVDMQVCRLSPPGFLNLLLWQLVSGSVDAHFMVCCRFLVLIIERVYWRGYQSMESSIL